MNSVDGGALQDLNDLRLFAAVVEHGGFSAAGRALGTPKSRLSKRVSQLEERLGVRLLQRTTRRFAVTEIGKRFHAHCRAALDEAQAAQDVIDELRAEPRGVVRLSCPVSLAQTVLAEVLPDFLAAHAQVQVQVLASNRRVDLIGEGYDLAIRVREKVDADASMIVRPFGQSRILLVASPTFLAMHGRPQTPAQLQALPLLSMFESDGLQKVDLFDEHGSRSSIELRPRMVCGEFAVLLAAALAGVGVATVPDSVCSASLARGELELALPGWSMPQGIMHLVYPSRRGQLPSVRALVEFLVEHLPRAIDAQHLQSQSTPSRPTAQLDPAAPRPARKGVAAAARAPR